MTTLTRKYKTRLEEAIRRSEINRKTIVEFNELYPEALDRFAKMYRYLGIIMANGRVKFIDEIWNKKQAV